MTSPATPDPRVADGLPAGRAGRRRDRHGRGPRGPAVLPGPLAPHGVPRTRSARDDFDALALGLFEGLEGRWGPQLSGVELGVEEAPVLDDWGADTVPLASLTRGRGGRPTRIVLFRQPLELRSDDRVQLTALVHRVLVEQVSELLGVPPAEVDPRYEEEE